MGEPLLQFINQNKTTTYKTYEFALIYIGIMTFLIWIASYFGEKFWVFEIFSHFQFIYFLSFMIIFTLMWAIRRKSLAVAFLIAAISVFIRMDLNIPNFFRDSHASTPSIRLVNLNVQYTNDSYERAVNYLERMDADLVVLPEMTPKWFKNIEGLIENGSYYHRSVLEENGRGVALLSRFPIIESKVVRYADGGLPVIISKVDIHGKDVTIFALHPWAPADQRRSKIREKSVAGLVDYIKTEDLNTIIMAGDFNLTPWSYLFKSLLDTGLNNSSNKFYVLKTWPTYSPIGIPIDHFLCSKDVNIINQYSGPSVGSDHHPLVVDFNIGSI